MYARVTTGQLPPDRAGEAMSAMPDDERQAFVTMAESSVIE